jgi:hypothetical protein
MPRCNLNLAWDRPLRDRAREALVCQWRLANPSDPAKLLVASHIARNAENHKERSLPGFDNLPTEEQDWLLARPVHGLANAVRVRDYVALRNAAARAFDEASVKYEPTEAEVDAACSGWWPRPSPGCPLVPSDGRTIPVGLSFIGDTKKGFALFTDDQGRLLVRDSRGHLSGFSGESGRHVRFGLTPMRPE